jgi:hypothetical protein
MATKVHEGNLKKKEVLRVTSCPSWLMILYLDLTFRTAGLEVLHRVIYTYGLP